MSMYHGECLECERTTWIYDGKDICITCHRIKVLEEKVRKLEEQR